MGCNNAAFTFFGTGVDDAPLNVGQIGDVGFDAEIASGDHHTVRYRHDFVNFVHALLVFDFGHDLDRLLFFT